MQTPTEGAILAAAMDSARQLTRYYLHKSKDLDVSMRFEVNGFTTNSIHWVVAHLAWAQDFLILQSINNAGNNLPWFEKVSIGQPYPALAHLPPYEEALQAFNTIHEQCLELIRPLTADALNTTNLLGIKFGSDASMRMMIHHCIRHEGTHTGHLGWLLRMHGGRAV